MFSLLKPVTRGYGPLFLCVLAFFPLVMVKGMSKATMLEQLYCGEANCYDLLGVPQNASSTDIRKAFRRLSLLHHPDRNKTKDAGQFFQTLAKANEVLLNNREAYDYYLAHPHSLLALYYGIRAHYPSHTSPSVAIGLLLVFVSLGQLINRQWKRKHLVGLVQDTARFKKAVDLKIQELHGSRYKRLPEREREVIREQISFSLLDTVEYNGSIVGCHPPALAPRDIFVIQCFLLPWDISRWLFSSLRWTIQYRILRRPYSVQDQTFLTRTRAGYTVKQWETLDDKQKEELLALKLWMPESYAAYQQQKEDQDRETRSSSARYRQWKRWRSKAAM